MLLPRRRGEIVQDNCSEHQADRQTKLIEKQKHFWTNQTKMKMIGRVIFWL